MIHMFIYIYGLLHYLTSIWRGISNGQAPKIHGGQAGYVPRHVFSEYAECMGKLQQWYFLITPLSNPSARLTHYVESLCPSDITE